jgi:hypothetical protein
MAIVYSRPERYVALEVALVDLELARLATDGDELAVPVAAEKLLLALVALGRRLALNAEQGLLGAPDVPDLDGAVMAGGKEAVGVGRVGPDDGDLRAVRSRER